MRGAFPLERQSHIVSFDDARRSVRADGVPMRAAAGAEGERGYARGSRDARKSRRASEAHGAYGARGARSTRESRSAHEARGARGSRDAWDTRGTGGYAFEAKRSFARTTDRFSEPEPQPERIEEAQPDRASFASRLSAKLKAAKRSRTKDKADRRFDRQYGGADARSSVGAGAGRRGSSGAGVDADAAGPRAAVYRGEMGTQHKRAARMQNTASGSARGGVRSTRKKRRLSPAAAVSAAVAACLLFGCVVLYGPAQQYYQEVRERDRLQAEYTALQERNDAMQSEVDALSTDAGIEDRAREEFGWVKDGESAGSVSGVEVEKESTFRANIVPGSVEAPDTWYSFLDPLFGVK